jgi:uncharacterized membrane protein
MSNVIFISASFSDAEKDTFGILLVVFIIVSVLSSVAESIVSKIREQQRLHGAAMQVKSMSSAPATSNEQF